MSVTATVSNPIDAYIVKNLYSLYLHDLSQTNGTVPNRHGILEPDDSVETLTAQGNVFSNWWSDAERIPYLIRENNTPAGLAFVVTGSLTQEDADFWLYEFFLMHAFRRKGVGQEAARQIFESHSGRWGLTAYACDIRANKFWHKTLSPNWPEYTTHRGPSPYRDSVDRVFFRFRSDGV